MVGFVFAAWPKHCDSVWALIYSNNYQMFPLIKERMGETENETERE